MSKNYKRYAQANGDPIQVDSAIRDGNGKNIANNYAKQNGFYSGLTSGLSVNIKTNQGAIVTDAVARLDPISVAVEDGDFASMTNFKGRSFAYNQLVQNGNFDRAAEWTPYQCTWSFSNNEATITITNGNNGSLYNNMTAISGHKYLFTCQMKKSNAGDTAIALRCDGSVPTTVQTCDSTNYTQTSIIATATQSSTIRILFTGYVNNQVFKVRRANTFDLTAMGINTTDVNEAIAALKSYGIDPSVYNEYSPGKIIDSQPNKIISRGFNQWDEVWELGTIGEGGVLVPSTAEIRTKNYINVSSNTTYYLNTPDVIIIHFWDEKFGYIKNEYISGARTYTTPINAKYMKFRIRSTYGTTYNHDICINISNTALNGTYKPYVANEYTITAPVMRSAGSVVDDKDNAKVGQVDLGSLNWENYASFSNTYWAPLSNLKTVSSSIIPNLLTTNYTPTTRGDIVSLNYDKVIGVHDNQMKIIVRDTTYSTPSAFKTAMNGVMLNYELATPIPQTDIVLPTNIITYNGGTLEIQYTSPNTTPGLVSMLYQVNLKNFIEGIGAREDINFQPNEITSHDELDQGLEQTYDDVKDDLEKGNIIPALSDNLTPYSDESGNLQTVPFVIQGTGCGNGENIIDTGSFAQLKEKRGNSVVVNQLASTRSGTRNITAPYSVITSVSNCDFTHKYLLKINFDTTFDRFEVNFNISGSGNVRNISTTETRNITLLMNPNYNGVGGIVLFGVNSTGITVNFDNFTLIDLTQWFGSNDRIPAYLLAHPEDFGRYYSGSLAYNTGTIVNSNARYLKSIGRNQWDEQWELGSIESNGQPSASTTKIRSKNFTECNPDTTYYFYVANAQEPYVFWYDENYNFIKFDYMPNRTKTSPNNAHYFKIRENITTYNNNITISLYYEDESGYNQYYPYEELENVDTGTEVLRSAGSVYDVKKPSGEITRNVSVLDLATVANYINYQSDIACWRLENQLANVPYGKYFGPYEYPNMLSVGRTITYYYDGQKNVDGKMSIDANGRLLFGTGSTTTKPTGIVVYELATPTTEQGTSFQENIKIDDFGSMKWDNESFNGVPQGNAIFYPVDYKAFIDSLNNYTDGDVTNLVTTTELTAEATARTSQDTILLNAIGGTLRQCLCVKESLDFNNTNVVDLGSLTWSYANGLFSASKPSDAVLNTTDNVATKILCSNYKTVARDYVYTNDKSVAMKYEILIRDTSYTDTTTFKNAMKGVLLAYEKAS